MIEIKVKENSVYQRISGSADIVLAELVGMVKVVVRNVVQAAREKGMDDDSVQNLHTALNFAMLESIGTGIAEGKEKSE